MSKIPTSIAFRIIPREDEFLDRKLGSRGEIFFDREPPSWDELAEQIEKDKSSADDWLKTNNL